MNILVLAEESLAKAIKTSIEKSPPPKPVTVEQVKNLETMADSEKLKAFQDLTYVEKRSKADEPQCYAPEITSFAQLGKILFPETEDLDPEAASFFHWRTYDCVIIQDLWLNSQSQDAHTTPRLFKAGYCFAELNSRLGNFLTNEHGTSTHIIVAITEESIRQDMQGLINSMIRFGYVDFWSVMAENSAWELNRLVFQSDLRTRSKEHIPSITAGGASSGTQSAPAGNAKFEFTDHDMGSVRQYVLQHAALILIDDEEEPLQRSLPFLTDVSEPKSIPKNMKGEGVYLISCNKDHHQQSRRYENFDQLYHACIDILNPSAERSSGSNRPHYVIFITDLSFRTARIHETGIDLIQRLNSYVKTHYRRHQIGLVAFTAFTSPFYATAAYHLGADFVILKTEDSQEEQASKQP